MDLDQKLDKIIDLLVAQNNLLTSIMISLRPSVNMPQQGFPTPNDNFNPHLTKTNNIRAEIEKKIQEARMEAQAKFAQIQASVPDMEDKLKG